MKHPSVTIYNKNKECIVIFPDYEVQKDYVDKEYKFCKTAFSAYAATITAASRKDTKSSLEDKRVAFARHLGYGPKRGNSKVWEKLEEKEPILA